jgi:enterochelin esterase-like enzyme
VKRDGERPGGARGYGAAKLDPGRLDSDNYRNAAGPRMAARASARNGRNPLDRRLIVGLATAAIVVLATVVSGSMDQSNATLVVMGFDPDRAQLITSLLVGGIASIAVIMTTGRFGLATCLGFVAAGGLFGGTFLAETSGALGANGANGAFDLSGWLLTILALVVSGAAAAWAGAALGSTARPTILRSLSVARDAVVSRHVERDTLRYPAGMAVLLILVVVAVPAFGDLVNFAPDSLMRRGAAPPVVAVATSNATDTGAPVGPADSAAPSPSADSGSGSSTPTTPPTNDTSRAPWLAWRPSGSGRIASTNMAAPWKGGTASTVDVTVYTPPGYDATGSRRYPVLYEAPTGYHLWGGATNVKTALDTLIDTGSIPATIVVFIDSAGGPFPNTECANSYDRREWYDTFAGQTVVAWTDAHFKAIADPAARAIVGMSEGGYCSAIIALHHPSVFGTAISFSGYFGPAASAAGPTGPFGANPALLANDSPTVMVGRLAPATRQQLYFILIAKPDQPGYGPDATAFEKLLSADGYPHQAIVATEPHGWPQVRDYFPAAVEAWAAREVTTGVFAGSA